MPRYLIVGNGVAGVTAAQGIANAAAGGAAGEVHIYGSEPHPYYQRPQLWKYLAGEVTQEELYFRPFEWYAARGIHVHPDTRVTVLDPTEHRIQLADGTWEPYDRLLLATGGRSFVPPFEGVDLQGVHALRSLDDALAIKHVADQVSNIAVIGGGLLGLETARALVAPGRRVSVIEIAPHLLPRQLDVTGAQVLQARLEAVGLRIYTDAATRAIVADASVGGTKATGVLLTSGRTVPAELVILSTGIRSRVELAREAGLETNRGIVVDEQLRTSAPDVYAAGDAAEFHGTVYGIIPAAIEQARAVAGQMTGSSPSAYDGTVPSTTLKIVGIDLTCLGDSTADGDEHIILRYSDQASGIYKRLALQDNVIVGVILMGDVSDARWMQRLIDDKRDVSAFGSRLLDGEVDLKALAQGTLP